MFPGTDANPGLPLDAACFAPVMAFAPPPVHRYAFDGTGTTLLDLIGDAHGTIVGGAALGAAGALTLDGIDDFVDLPNGLISGLSAVTVMMWVQWDSGPQRQVLFDFGSSQQGEGLAGTTETTMSVLASRPGSGLTARVETPSFNSSSSALPTLTIASVHQVTLEILPSSGSLRLYLDGAEIAKQAGGKFSLADIVDVNVWLGRGQDSGDTFFRGKIHDLRIYDRVLGECAVLAAFRAGPDTTSFARCAQPEPDCSFARYAQLGAWVCPSQRTWFSSADVCAAAGMHLVNVNDAVENDALSQELGSSNMWTGYNDITQDGKLVWCGPGSTFEFFASGEPSSASDADCVQRDATSTSSSWRIVECLSAAAFACEP